MMSIHTWSITLSELIGTELNLDEAKKSVVSYGLEVIIGALIKIIVFVLVPLILGILKPFIIAYITAGILKLSSGGYHCSAYYRCLITTLLIYITIAELAVHLPQDIPVYVITMASLIIALVVFTLVAPVDVPEKPIISPKRRKALKVASIASVVILILILLIIQPVQSIMFAICFSVLFHVFTLTKSGQGFLGWLDNHI